MLGGALKLRFGSDQHKRDLVKLPPMGHLPSFGLIRYVRETSQEVKLTPLG